MPEQTGVLAQIFADGRDVTPFLRSAQITLALGTVRDTKFRPPGFANTYEATLRGGQASYSGDFPLLEADRVAELEDAIGSAHGPRIIQVNPWGAEVGYLAILGKSLRSSFSTSTEVEGLISYNGGFELTSGSPGVECGLTLFTPNGVGDIELPVIQTITQEGVSAVRTITTPGGDTFTINPGDSAATVQTAARATDDAEFDSVVVSGEPVAGTMSVLSVGGTSSFSGALSGDHVNVWDGDPDTASWQNLNGWQGYDVGSAVVVNSYSIRPQNADGTQAPAAWTLKASNTGDFSGEEVTLDSKSGYEDSDWTDTGDHGKRIVFTIANTTAYRYYRFTWTDATTSDVVISDLELGAVTYSGTYTFAFPTSAGAVGAMTSASGDTTVATTQEYGVTSDRNVVTEASNGTAIHDVAAATTNGLQAVLQVVNAVGAGKTITCRITGSADGSTGWAAITGATFEAMTDTGAQLIEVAKGVSIPPYLRLEVTDITGQFVISASCARL